MLMVINYQRKIFLSTILDKNSPVTRLLILVAIVMVSCEPQISDHPVFKYYPPTEVLEDGYVSKYYRHYYPKNSDQNASTEIGYSKYKKVSDKILLNSYNAGFDHSGILESRVSGTQIFTERVVDINQIDTIEIDIISSIREDWGAQKNEPYELKYVFNEKDYSFTENQLDVYDTLIDGAAAKVLVTESFYRDLETDEIVNQFKSKDIYVEGLGYYSTTADFENFRMELELVEQMPIEEFERRADHDKHRIAWIDPDKTLDSDAEFKICGGERRIADYYNSTPDGRYIHGKRAMLDTIFNNLDEAKLLEQNGRLTFRFVVNCEGQTGRFIVNGYDFMYQPIKFEQETIDHLYGILRKLESWRPVVLQDESRDAYFYITFNIEDGKITDILP